MAITQQTPIDALLALDNATAKVVDATAKAIALTNAMAVDANAKAVVANAKAIAALAAMQATWPASWTQTETSLACLEQAFDNG